MGKAATTCLHGSPYIFLAIHIPYDWLLVLSCPEPSHTLILSELLFGCLHARDTSCMSRYKTSNFKANYLHPEVHHNWSYEAGSAHTSLHARAQASNQDDYVLTEFMI